MFQKALCRFFLLTLMSPVWANQEQVLTNDDIVRMIKAGIGEDVIIQLIATSQCEFKSDVDSILRLKKEDVPEPVIKAMISKVKGEAVAEGAEEPGPSSDPPTRRHQGSLASFTKAQFFRPVGTKTDKIKGTLQLDPEAQRVLFIGKKAGEPVLQIDYSSVKKVVYEKSKKPRYALAVFVSPLFLFSRSKRHWMTLEYSAGGSTKTVVIRLDKGNVDQALRAVEEHTGVKVEYTAAIG